MLCMLQELSDVTDPGTLEKLYSEGHDAADFLTQNVVQAELNDRGNYGKAVRVVAPCCLEVFHAHATGGGESVQQSL